MAVALESAAWRLHAISGHWARGGWLRLQHVQSGKFLRLVPPPHSLEWTLSVEIEPERFGKQTWWQIECGRARCESGEVYIRVHPDATGAHINYRGNDLIRGHGDKPPWKPAGQMRSSAIRLETFGLERLLADMEEWAPRRHACYAPCEASGDMRLASGSAAWDDACASIFAEPVCSAIVRVYKTRPGVTWGSAPPEARMRFARLGCHNYLSAEDVIALAGPAPADWQAAAWVKKEPARAPAIKGGGGHMLSADQMHCARPVHGIILLLVSDRPNQFLCHYLAAAMVSRCPMTSTAYLLEMLLLSLVLAPHMCSSLAGVALACLLALSSLSLMHRRCILFVPRFSAGTQTPG